MNTVISLRIDKGIKASAQEVAESVGLKLGTIINAYLRQVAITRRIEFYAPEKMSSKLEGLISEVEAELQAGKVSKKFNTTDDFVRDLKR